MALNETIHAGQFLYGESESISTDQITVKSGQAAMQAGTVLGKIVTASATETHAGNTGNGVMGTITVGDGAQEGVYTLLVTAAASNAGSLQLKDPQGEVVGTGTVAVAFSGGGLSFTLADGATDFAVGDKFLITVTKSAEKFVQLNLSGTDGSEAAAGILYAYTDASSADTQATAITRYQEVSAVALTWPGSISDAQKASATAQLALLGIILR